MEKEVGGNFLSEIVREKDEAFVISFDVDVDLLQDFTSSVHSLKEALNSAKINTGGGGGSIGGLGGGPFPTQALPKELCSTTPFTLPLMMNSPRKSAARP